MKKLLSIILAVCMVAAIMPAVPTTAAAVENPITYTYNFRSAATGGVGLGVPTIDSYDKTTSSGKWMYYAMSSDLAELYATSTSRFDTQSYGIRVQPSAKAMYAQLKLSIAELAIYIPTLTYYNNGSASIDIEVFLAPASASDCFASEYKLGNYTHRSVSTSQEDTISFSPVTTSETEYILSFRVGSHVGNISLAQFELKETEAPKVEYTYDFTWGDAAGLLVVPDMTEYLAKDGTNGYWTYYGMSEGFAAVQAGDSRAFEINHYSPAKMNIQFKTTGQYAQLLIKVPKANTYFTPKLSYVIGSASEKMKVYIAPKSAANPRADEYLKGIFNAREKTSTGDTVTLEGFMTNATDAEYILTFENASLGTGHNLLLGSLTLFEEDAKEIKPVKEEYAFNFGYASGADQFNVGIPTLDTYEKTMRNWKYCNMESSLKTSYENGGSPNTAYAKTLTGCFSIQPSNATGQWLSVTLEGMNAGTYDVDYTFASHANGGIGEIYLAPASVAENARINPEYKIGTIDYFKSGASHTTGSSAKLMKTTLPADGDYVVTFKHSGTKNQNAGGYIMAPSALKFTETEPDAPAGTVADAKVSFTVQAEKGGCVSVEGGYDAIDDIEQGKSITATATPDAGYSFAYWRNAAGTWLSSKVTENFTMNTNTGIIAVFDKAPADADAEVPVYFYNENGSLIDSKTVEKEKTFGEIKIAQPSIAGFVFDKWSVEDNAVITKLTRAVALYKASDETYDVTVGGTIAASGNYGDFVTVTSSDNNFSYWMLGDDIVSYDKSFTFRVYGNITLTEICEGAKRAQPTVALDVIGENYFLGYTVPAGYVKIEAGILFAKSGTPTIINFNSKASEKTGSGQFVAQASTDGETIARGYVVFKNPEGETRVMYTN